MTIAPSHLPHAFDGSRWGSLLLLATVRISVRTASGKFSGSGFLVDRHPDGGGAILITAKHLVNGALDGVVHMLPLAPTPTNDVTAPFIGSEWLMHPDADVAAMPMGAKIDQLGRMGHRPLFGRYKHEMFPTVEDMQFIEAFEDVVFVGFPQGMWDTTNKTPTVRRGMTATPIWQDYKGQQEFLIDGAVFPGNSGGPALMVHRNGFNGPNGFEVSRIRTVLLGVVIQSTSVASDADVSTGGKVTVAQPASIATVVKWTRILELLSRLPKS